MFQVAKNSEFSFYCAVSIKKILELLLRKK